jgi:hypothetical protein
LKCLEAGGVGRCFGNVSEWCSAGVYREITRYLRIDLVTPYVAGLVSADIGVGGDVYSRRLAIAGLVQRGKYIHHVFSERISE